SSVAVAAESCANGTAVFSPIFESPAGIVGECGNQDEIPERMRNAGRAGDFGKSSRRRSRLMKRRAAPFRGLMPASFRTVCWVNRTSRSGRKPPLTPTAIDSCEADARWGRSSDFTPSETQKKRQMQFAGDFSDYVVAIVLNGHHPIAS